MSDFYQKNQVNIASLLALIYGTMPEIAGLPFQGMSVKDYKKEKDLNDERYKKAVAKRQRKALRNLNRNTVSEKLLASILSNIGPLREVFYLEDVGQLDVTLMRIYALANNKEIHKLHLPNNWQEVLNVKSVPDQKRVNVLTVEECFEPVSLLYLENKYFLIDGLHRIAKRQGIEYNDINEVFNAYIFGIEECIIPGKNYPAENIIFGRMKEVDGKYQLTKT